MCLAMPSHYRVATPALAFGNISFSKDSDDVWDACSLIGGHATLQFQGDEYIQYSPEVHSIDDSVHGYKIKFNVFFDELACVDLLLGVHTSSTSPLLSLKVAHGNADSSGALRSVNGDEGFLLKASFSCGEGQSSENAVEVAEVCTPLSLFDCGTWLCVDLTCDMGALELRLNG